MIKTRVFGCFCRNLWQTWFRYVTFTKPRSNDLRYIVIIHHYPTCWNKEALAQGSDLVSTGWLGFFSSTCPMDWIWLNPWSFKHIENCGIRTEKLRKGPQGLLPWCSSMPQGNGFDKTHGCFMGAHTWLEPRMLTWWCVSIMKHTTYRIILVWIVDI